MLADIVFFSACGALFLTFLWLVVRYLRGGQRRKTEIDSL
jgi:hypothetical protein